jgi:hypothetical protein
MITERRKQLLFSGAAALGGSLLFAYAVSSVGLPAITDGIRRVGSGLLLILAIGGVRFCLRAQAWRLCMRPEVRLPLGPALRAFVAGDAIGSVTPLGLVASEPAKALIASTRLPPADAVSSLAADNVIYAASAAGMVAAGVGVALLTVPLSTSGQEIAAAALALFAGGAVAATRLMRGTWTAERGPRPPWRARLAQLRQAALGFADGHPERVWGVFALGVAFHAFAVLEVYLVLGWLMGEGRPTWTQSIVFEALNRAITIAFKFVPFRVGVDEALSGALAPVLALASASGVTLAVIRKVRNLFWAGVGLALIGAHRVRRDAPASDLRGT